MLTPSFQVRAAVTELLDAWVEASPPEGLIAELLDSLSGPKCSTDGKRDGLTWLASAVASGNAGGDLPGLLRLAVVGSSDKTIDVREAAAKLVTALVEVSCVFLASGRGAVQGWYRQSWFVG